MKKVILFALFFFTSELWSETTLEQHFQLEFSGDFFNPSFCKSDEELQVTELCDAYVDNRLGLNANFWCNESVCNSLIDSSVFFFMHEITHSECYLSNEKCFALQFFVLSGTAHSLMDVIRDEFINYQRCHFLCISQEQLDSVFAEMERTLLPELERKRSGFFYVKAGYEEDAVIIDCQTGGSCLWGGSGDIEQIIDERNSIESLPYRMDFAARLRAENGFLIVPADLEGQAFSIFSLNGRVLRKGELRNNMPLPHEPTILRVKGYGDMYLK